MSDKYIDPSPNPEHEWQQGDSKVIDINNVCRRCNANRDSYKYISCMNEYCDQEFTIPSY